MAPRKGRKPYEGKPGRYSEERIAWARIENATAIIRRYAHEEGDEPGDRVTLTLDRPGSRFAVTIDLTHLTGEELAGLKKVLLYGIELAEPIVAERDESAKKEGERGDDTLARLYRQLPVVVVREGQERRDDQGVRLGSEVVPDVDSGPSIVDRLLAPAGDPSGAVADGAPEGVGTEDDEPEADDDEVVLPVPR